MTGRTSWHAFYKPKLWPRFWVSLGLLGLVFAIFFWVGMASAQVADPFAAQGAWMSLEDYTKEKIEEKDKGDVQLPAAMEKDAEKNQEEAKKKELERAQPERPLNYPVMPSGGEQERAVPAPSSDVLPEEEGQWLDPEQIHARIVKEEAARRFLEEEGKTGFNIRYATLPGSDVASILADRVSKPNVSLAMRLAARKKELAQDLMKKTMPKEDKDACAALNDFRRRQLEALESDRKTLAALKAALSDLGVANKLDFMTDSTGYMSSISEAEPPMDLKTAGN